MQSFVLFYLGDKIIAIPFLKTRCWKGLDQGKVILGARELPERCEFCWEIYCNLPVTSCILRQQNARLGDVDLSGFQLTEADEPTLAELFGNLFPGKDGLFIRRMLFPPESKISSSCPLLPRGISSHSVEHIAIINPEGIRKCRDVAVRRGLSCGACKAAAAA